MVGHVGNVGREKTLVRFIHARGDICPPKESLNEWRSVVGANFKFKKTFARMQADAMHAFHAAHRIVITAPNCFGAVGMFLDLKIYRQKRRGTMMLRPVEFNAAGNPRTGETDERRLDDSLIINHVAAVRLVL